MKIHWSIADQELQFAIEHTGKTVQFGKIFVPFVRVSYFMWGHEDGETITKRIEWIGTRLKTLIFG